MKYIDNPELLNLHFKNGTMILPWYYTSFMYKMNAQKFSGEGIMPVSKYKRLLNLLKQIRMFKLRKSDILIFSSCLFNVKDDNGKYFNSLHGYYYNVFPNDALLIEDGDINNVWRPTGDYANLSYVNSFYTFISSLLAGISNKIKRQHSKDYESFCSFFPEWIKVQDLSYVDYYIRYYSFFINHLIKKVRPKVVLINCGSYGMELGIICKIVHDNNAIAIDTQHGQVYHHGAYSASPMLNRSMEYMHYMPDYLYSFGDYWSNCVEWSYEKVAMGNPFLNKYVEKFANIKEADKDVLIISQPIYKELQIPFVKKVARLLKDLKIVIRLHPVESISEQAEIYKDCENISFSSNTNILYKDMCSSKYVVGWNSTCLYELMGFGRIPFIIDNEISQGKFPDTIGTWVKTPDELCEKIRSGYQATIDNADTYWKQNFADNVSKHIYQLLTEK